ncbi:MAG: hypothetical protein JWL61_3107 [Gemmatimonadetes bacterium]|nr:hypothetical protein [Gemmatimonadota bacterium]
MTRTLLVMALALPLLAGTLEAQGALKNRPGALRPGRRLQQQPPAETPAARRQLEQQVRRGLWQVAKRRIGFTDDQMLQLERTSQRFDVQRRQLAQQEKAQRVALRGEILADSAANQAAIAASLDKLHDLQRQRLDMQAEEQKEFSTFMTPLQRAKFLALQEQVRKRLQELVRARPDSSPAASPQLP